MAVDHDSLNNLTTTSVPTDIGSGPLCGRYATVARLDPLPDLRRLSPERLKCIADIAEWLASGRTNPFPIVELAG